MARTWRCSPDDDVTEVPPGSVICGHCGLANDPQRRTCERCRMLLPPPPDKPTVRTRALSMADLVDGGSP